MNSLTNKGLTLHQVYLMSIKYYDDHDDKSIRSILDIDRAKLIERHNLTYNPNTKVWEQSGRDIKIVCTVTTDPVSYKRPDWDKNKKHKFPVTFLIHNLNLGFESTFRWRTGSLKKPLFPKSGMSKEMKENLQKKNIKNGIQHQFFFELEYILKLKNLLYGICYAQGAPTVRNPDHKIFFDKHALYVFNRIIYPFITSKKGINKKLISKNLFKQKYVDKK